MRFDLNELTPMPWIENILDDGSNDVTNLLEHSGQIVASGIDNWHDAFFIALCRNAFGGDPEALAWWETNRRRRE